MFDARHPEAIEAVRRALAEDIGTGDITTELTVEKSRRATGTFNAKEAMTVAGTELLPVVYELFGGVDTLEILKPSGTRVEAGECLARVSGLARTLLTCERTALNFIQRLSGVATVAAAFAEQTKHTSCRVLDTRKTTPGLRRVEKMAAEAGGIVNHRVGLFDAILIKNNHIAAAGGVKQALAAVAAQPLPAEIEVRTREELDQALAHGARHLLLDNLTPDEARVWIADIRRRAPHVKIELSGNITLATARAYAETGADYLSSGSITHSARAMDINFRLTLER